MARKPTLTAPVIKSDLKPAVQIIPDTPPLTFTNRTARTTIHLGDGRKLAPGESVEVGPVLYAELTA